MALAEGRIRRLIVTMPPRHGKSELCSKYLPAWFLGTYPSRRVILCSYEANFAADWGGKARDVLLEHGGLFGVAVRADRQARDDWGLEVFDGGMVTAGVGGAVTGRGANLLIVDDPVKNAEEADSEVYRDKVWRWWTSTAYTRLEPNGSALLIMTRWHDDDLAGRLLRQDQLEPDGDPWEVVNLPAVAEEGQPDALGRSVGEALWPERWPLENLKAIFKRVGSRVVAALFQQRPQDAMGGYFKRSWFKAMPRNRVPRLIDAVRAWDLAATADVESTDPDWLVGALLGKGEDGAFYVLDVIRERVSPAEVERILQRTAVIDGPSVKIRIEQEGAASGKIVAWHFSRMLEAFDVRFTGIPKASKAVRASPYNAALERGDVWMLQAEWNVDFVNEHARFPTGAHDDQVDAAAHAYACLTNDLQTWDGANLRTVFSGGRWNQPAKKSTHELLMEKLTGGRN